MGARFRDTGRESFWGDYIYDQIVPKDHFLRQLAGLFDWDRLASDLVNYYKGGAEYGGVPYHPSTVLKMLLLSYLYKLSERQTELFVSDSLAARYFLGIAATEPAPDHSTLSVFRDRIVEKGGVEVFEQLFQRIVRLAREKGIKFGQIQVVDATHSIADVDVKKDDERKDKGDKPRDGDATWGTKGRRKAKTADGKTVTVNKTFHGYKSHVSLNAESGLITAVLVTTGRMTDGQQFETLVAKDEEAGVDAKIYAGDKGYDDGENHELLRSKGEAVGANLEQLSDREEGWEQGAVDRVKGESRIPGGEEGALQSGAEVRRRKALSRLGTMSIPGLGEVWGAELPHGDDAEPEADREVVLHTDTNSRPIKLIQGISMPSSLPNTKMEAK